MRTEWNKDWKPLAGAVALFLGFYFLPVGVPRFDAAITEALSLARWYAREHVVLCLLPALFIAGAIGVFINQAAVMRYLGPRANKFLAYGVASISGSILAVCSCTVLPLFAGIYKMGAGLGPACAFLYSGPAINVLAIVLTARVLGPRLGVARAVGAVLFSIVIGLLMHLLFRREELAKAEAHAALPEAEVRHPLGHNVIYFALMIGILVFANWARPGSAAGAWQAIYEAKWWITAALALSLGAVLALWYSFRWRKIAAIAAPAIVLAIALPGHPEIPFAAGILLLSAFASADGGEAGDWFAATWGFAKQILPLLLIGVLIAGFLLGRPGRDGVIPSEWVARAVGGNSLRANLFASVAGAFMYFATLTEVPIVQGLMGSGMGEGPALALLLAGPALSLPSMLVLRSILGLKKTVAFVILVIILATATGMIYGAII